jgi:glycosyltransferase involved in cell wall biosynthesis
MDAGAGVRATLACPFMDYLIAVQAPCRPLANGSFATESAFAEHLRGLRAELGSQFDRIVLAAPTDGAPPDAPVPDHLETLHPQRDGVHLLPMHPASCSGRSFWLRHAVPLWRRLREAARQAGVVHAGLADDIRRPAMALADLAGLIEGRPVVFVVDIDFRRDAWMSWKSGLWPLRAYVKNRLVQDTFKMAQVHLARRSCALVLRKSGRMVDEVGRGAPHVRNFHDSALRADHILDDAALQSRVQRLASATGPLQLVSFCRLVPYKGVERIVRAVHRVHLRDPNAVRLRIIGEGSEGPRIDRLIDELELQGVVTLEPPVPYGPALHGRIDDCDLSVATPLMEDSPRNAFDAMARGLPILAFDIQYYRDLERESGAVRTVAWPEVDALARGIAALAADRDTLAQMARRGVAFARANTQAAWLHRRVRWTLEAMERHGGWTPTAGPASAGAQPAGATSTRREGPRSGIDGRAAVAPVRGDAPIRAQTAASSVGPGGSAHRGN